MSRLAFDTSASVCATSPAREGVCAARAFAQERLEPRDDVQKAHAIAAADVEDLTAARAPGRRGDWPRTTLSI